jgi:hypothetical protein
MAHSLLDVDHDLTGTGLVPAPIQFLGGNAELDDEIAGQVLGLDLSTLLPPQLDQPLFVIAHDGPGVGAAVAIGATCCTLLRSPT